MVHYHYLAKKLAIYHSFRNIKGSTTFLKLEFVKLEFQKLEFSEKFWKFLWSSSSWNLNIIKKFRDFFHGTRVP